MPKPDTGDKPKKGKVRKVIREITIRTFGALVAKLLADMIREVTGWLASLIQALTIALVRALLLVTFRLMDRR